MKTILQLGVNNASDLRDFLNTYTDQELTALYFDGEYLRVSIDEHALTDGSPIQFMRFTVIS